MSTLGLLTQIPVNTNFLQTTKYEFSFPKLPYLRYFCQTVILPSVNTGEAIMETPFSATYRHGDKLVYDPLSLTVLVDEDLRVFEETYDWLKGLTFPHEYAEYQRNNKRDPELYQDGILSIHTNSNNPNLRIKFTNCWPTSLGSIQFAATDTADIIPVVDITFRYDTFIFDRME